MQLPDLLVSMLELLLAGFEAMGPSQVGRVLPAALVSGVLASSGVFAKAVPERADIDAQFKWDLTDMYAAAAASALVGKAPTVGYRWYNQSGDATLREASREQGSLQWVGTGEGEPGRALVCHADEEAKGAPLGKLLLTSKPACSSSRFSHLKKAPGKK